MNQTDTLGAAGSLAAYDREEALRCTDGDAELAAELLETLLAGLPGEMAGLQGSLNAQDWGQLAELAHRTRGATRYCGTLALDAAVVALERAAKMGDLDTSRAMFEEVRVQAQRLRAQCDP